MTSFAHFGDTHIVERSGDAAAALAEQVELLQELGEDAFSSGAKFILHGGDVFDRTSTPTERMAAIEVFTSWASQLPVVVVRGNHDRPLDLAYISHLATRHPIYVFEQPDVITVAGATIACLPWPRKALLAAALDTTSDLELGEAAAAGMRAILHGLKAQLSMAKGPTVLLGHVELGGSRLDNGQPVAGNCDVSLHEGDLLDVGADVVCLSHIHLHQVLGDGRIVYAGAPRPTRFGDDADKGYCLIDVAAGNHPVIEHRKAHYRPMETVRFRWDDQEDILSPLQPPSVPIRGAALRLVYTVSESCRHSAGLKAAEVRDRWLAAGAHSVTIDARVTTVHRVRSEEINNAQTTVDRVRAYWASRGAVPARSVNILEKLQLLEASP